MLTAVVSLFVLRIPLRLTKYLELVSQLNDYLKHLKSKCIAGFANLMCQASGLHVCHSLTVTR